MRAVLIAHAQSTKNRMFREMGRTSATASVVFLSLLSLFAIIPLGGGLGMIGYVLMENIDDASSVAILASLFTLFPIFGGMTSGLVAGARELAWERYRVYPIRVRSLFFAELVAAFGDVIPFFVALSAFAMTVGMAVSEPRVLAVAPLVWLESVVMVLVVQMLVGALAESLVKRLRTVLGVCVALCIVVAAALSSRSGSAHRGDPSALFEKGQRLFTSLTHVMQWLPTGSAMKSLGAAANGDFSRAYLLHIYPLVALAACCGLAAWLMAREAQNVIHAVDKSSATRLWTFGSPWAGVARAHATTMMRSPLGRFGLLMPLISLVLIKSPLAHALGTAQWGTLSTFSYVAISTVQMHFGAFGMDGHGIKTLLLLPISPRDLLVGKMSAVALYHAVQLLILSVFLLGIGDASLLDIAAGYLLATSIFFTQAAIGHRVSVWMPRAFPKKGMRRTAMPLPLTLLSLGTFVFSASLYGAAFVVGSSFGQGPLFAFMLLGVGVSVCIYLIMLRGLPAFFERHREKLLSAVGD